MKKPLAIIAGEPNSISSEIILKSWKLRGQYTHKPLFIIGSIQLLNLQKKKLKYRIKIKKINENFKINELNGTEYLSQSKLSFLIQHILKYLYGYLQGLFLTQVCMFLH